MLAQGGAGDSETEKAQEIDWQTFNNQMITAAREVLVAVTEQDEESLLNAGNNALYPPCESCHQKYQQQ
jgi:cytochrome c556